MKFPDAGSSQRLELRPLTEADVTETYLGWFRDGIVVNHLEARDLTRQDVVDYIARGNTLGTYRIYAVIWRETGEHVGNLKIGEVKAKHGTSDLVTVIGARSVWGKGIGKEAIELGNRLAFEHMGLRKLAGGIYANNIGSLKAYLGAGWEAEAVLPAHLMCDGVPTDYILVACYNPRFFPRTPALPVQFSPELNAIIDKARQSRQPLARTA